MSSLQEPGIPWEVPTGYGLGFVVPPEIPNDPRVLGIGSKYSRAAANQTVNLIEIRSLGNIGRNNRIVAEGFRDTVHLDGECDRNSGAIEFSRQLHHSRTAPTVPKQQDCRVGDIVLS